MYYHLNYCFFILVFHYTINSIVVNSVQLSQIENKRKFSGEFANKSQHLFVLSNQVFQNTHQDTANNINKGVYQDLIKPHVINASFSQEFTIQVNRNNEYIFEYIYNASLMKNKALRISVHCPSSAYKYPLLVVVRQQRRVLSWQLPLEPPPNTFAIEEYRRVSRTLCPTDGRVRSSKNIELSQRLFVDVTTSSPEALNFSVQVNLIDGFVLELDTSRSVDVAPGESIYYKFSFPDDVDMVLVKATSEDDVCAMVSIQNVSCPVFDTEQTIRYGNFYQTMTYKAGITVRKEKYPNGFFVVVVVLSTDDMCAPNYQHIFLHRRKKVSISVEEKIKFLEYLAAIFAGLGYCAFFYVVTLILACVEYVRAKKRSALLSLDQTDNSYFGNQASADLYPTQNADLFSSNHSIPEALCVVSVSSSQSDEDYDTLDDAENEKDVFRTKVSLFVSDMSRMKPRLVQRKSFIYIFGLLTIAVFYAVPVVQLVVTYQKVLVETGNQDICFYNFWCSHPLGPLSDFNHVYSNIAYILFGVLFIALCIKREKKQRKSTADRKRLGIPQYMGLLYAMGGALIMEGLLSGCYHICPNHSNFQFDTAFMYVMAVLCMLKIYQTRHPDLSTSAYVTYLTLAFAVLLGVVGVLSDSIYFWVVFGFLHVVGCCILSAHVYYMGRWKLDRAVVSRWSVWCRGEMRDFRTFIRPSYCDRMVLLLIANGANWGLSIYGVVKTPKDFASFLLIIFLTNLLLYIAFYIIMKLRHGESILLQPFVYLLLCMGSWGLAAYFYLLPRTTWEMSPAHSRQYNQDCSALHFYDTHDVWHFLSSSAMFFGFMLLLTLDDDLKFTPREKIPVF